MSVSASTEKKTDGVSISTPVHGTVNDDGSVKTKTTDDWSMFDTDWTSPRMFLATAVVSIYFIGSLIRLTFMFDGEELGLSDLPARIIEHI
jgi:hypothetical protein